MIISTKGRYGLRAVFELARRYGDGPQSISLIARHQAISEAYLEQLFAVLRRDGIIKSTRGASGGYTLAKDPADISVGDVLTSLEGPLTPAGCVGGENCVNYLDCAAHVTWQKIYDGINSVVNSISLQNMIDDSVDLPENTDMSGCM